MTKIVDKVSDSNENGLGKTCSNLTRSFISLNKFYLVSPGDKYSRKDTTKTNIERQKKKRYG